MILTRKSFLNMTKEYMQKYPGQRKGQAMFNLLSDIDFEMAEFVRGTAYDPFNNSHNIPRFLDEIFGPDNHVE